MVAVVPVELIDEPIIKFWPIPTPPITTNGATLEDCAVAVFAITILSAHNVPPIPTPPLTINDPEPVLLATTLASMKTWSPK